jgi:hypothetical protein
MECIGINEQCEEWRGTWQDSKFMADINERQRERDFREGYMRGFEMAQKTPIYFAGIDPVSDNAKPSISVVKGKYIERVFEGMTDEIREELWDKDLLQEMVKYAEKNKPEVTRVEVIQHSPPYNGRAYTNYAAKEVEVQYQDGGRTLKVFCK